MNVRMGDLAGEHSTWATVRVWNERTFQYDEVLDLARGVDEREGYRRLHSPLFVVRCIRYAMDPPIYPWKEDQ